MMFQMDKLTAEVLAHFPQSLASLNDFMLFCLCLSIHSFHLFDSSPIKTQYPEMDVKVCVSTNVIPHQSEVCVCVCLLCVCTCTHC